ncbi:glycosyl transferase family 9 [Gemmatirosa kalamazoonensis]|uniref:Glycosyl transferase family 9 n=1 Tax=Gemmatirosa kalamazoonensis TaxID=861299 RepID=W0RJN6_9BACT|nr:glycosyltransferase family 9 protein [Gemmatirosa kalamazoonensis]AHG91289.1 glycosyl transferase family 9 [Gemmatirosa kalamazoonensis]
MALPIPAPRPDPAERWPNGPRREVSLVVQTSFLGDVVLTTPLIAELAQRGAVDVVVRPDGAALLANNPDVRRVIVFDKRGTHAGAGGVWRMGGVLRRLAREDGDARRVAYLAQGSVRSATLAMLGGFAERVGFETSRSARPLYTRVVRYRADRHHAERLWSLAMPDDAQPAPEALRPRLHPGYEERRAVSALLSGFATGDPIVALAPGSVWATKRWPYYAELAARLAATGAQLVVVGGPGDAELARAIVAAAPAALDATGKLSLLASAELIGRCATLVTNDSAPQHLASAMGVPTVTIFGPTVPEFGFGPLAPGSRTAGHPGLACRPCDAHGPQRCPLGHWRCMRELTPETIAQVVGAVTADHATRHAPRHVAR